jgi:peptidoglycan-associated lipoprotein
MKPVNQPIGERGGEAPFAQVNSKRISNTTHYKRRFIMSRKAFCMVVIILCFGLTMTGCPKKTVVKEEPSVKTEEPAAKREGEQAKKSEEKTAKEFEKTLVAKKEPGIEGEVFESKLIKDIHFDFDKYNIRPAEAEILKENAALLKTYSKGKIQIEGHCDERGTTEYNLALGERRANSTKKYLLSLGIPADRLSTISYGKEKPLDPGHNEEAWAKNRRGHFVILSK